MLLKQLIFLKIYFKFLNVFVLLNLNCWCVIKSSSTEARYKNTQIDSQIDSPVEPTSVNIHSNTDRKCNPLASAPYLPEEEVAEAHLPGGSDEEVRVWGVTAVQTLAEKGLGHVATPRREKKS